MVWITHLNRLASYGAAKHVKSVVCTYELWFYFGLMMNIGLKKYCTLQWKAEMGKKTFIHS